MYIDNVIWASGLLVSIQYQAYQKAKVLSFKTRILTRLWSLTNYRCKMEWAILQKLDIHVQKVKGKQFLVPMFLHLCLLDLILMFYEFKELP